MKLTSAILAGFIGGDIDIHSPKEGWTRRGPITVATIENEDTENAVLKVECVWMAESQFVPSDWAVHAEQSYTTQLSVVSTASATKGMVIGHNHITGMEVHLIPPTGSKLDPKRVRGLELTGDAS